MQTGPCILRSSLLLLVEALFHTVCRNFSLKNPLNGDNSASYNKPASVMHWSREANFSEEFVLFIDAGQQPAQKTWHAPKAGALDSALTDPCLACHPRRHAAAAPSRPRRAWCTARSRRL
eukprot:5123806-Pleurochrysis_carterae.AAC.2